MLSVSYFVLFLDIKSLTGEPDYRSVNLTWDVESFENEVSNSEEQSDENDFSSKAYTVYYCELQTWGAHRCKSKVLEDTDTWKR